MIKRFSKDSGAANTVSFIVIIFFIMMMLISFIDVGLYFNVKNEMQAAAENGARNVAIYGGTGGNLRASKSGVVPAVDVVKKSINSKFQGTSKLVKVQDVTCTPIKAIAGNEVSCTVKYVYTGLAGDFGIFNLAGNNVTIKGSSVSEVTVK